MNKIQTRTMFFVVKQQTVSIVKSYYYFDGFINRMFMLLRFKHNHYPCLKITSFLYDRYVA